MFRRTASIPGLRMWWRWIAGSTLGSVILLLIARPVLGRIPAELNDLAMSILLLALGCSMGVGQWLVLCRRVGHPSKWIAASGLGFLSAAYLSFPLKLQDIYLGTIFGQLFQLDEVLYGSAFGLLLGCVQWLVIRSHVRRAGWWTVASTIGWTMSYAIAEGVPFDWNGAATFWFHQAATTAMAAGIFGIFLIRQIKPAEEPACA